jgi:hypothetical protein
MTDSSSLQGGLPTSIKLQLSDSNKNLFLDSRMGLTPRLIGQLTSDRKVALISKRVSSEAAVTEYSSVREVHAREEDCDRQRLVER